MKKQRDYSRKETLVLDTFVKLMRAVDSYLHRTHQHLDEAGLTLSQFQVLEILYHLGPLCQRDIAEKVLKTTGNLTMVVNNLEKNKLVKRVRDKVDKRYYSIHLTKKGEKLINELFPKHLKVMVEEMSVLTTQEQETLAALSKKLGLKK